jgi:hypothetical protein
VCKYKRKGGDTMLIKAVISIMVLELWCYLHEVPDNWFATGVVALAGIMVLDIIIDGLRRR